MICTADGCGAGFAVAFIALSFTIYYCWIAYLKYKQGKDVDE